MVSSSIIQFIPNGGRFSDTVVDEASSLSHASESVTISFCISEYFNDDSLPPHLRTAGIRFDLVSFLMFCITEAFI
jgi:hypothetical protein